VEEEAMPTGLPNERQLREPGSLELDPSGEGVAIEETRRLIASSKVEGTPVFNRTGEQLGTVYNFMVDKVSGQVAYVVMSFGGFLGIGESYHPLPWRALTYDTRLGGYVVDVDKDRLASAPRYGADEDPFTDDEYGSQVDAYYRTTPTA
jgi:PRC-barrel domain